MPPRAEAVGFLSCEEPPDDVAAREAGAAVGSSQWGMTGNTSCDG